MIFCFVLFFDCFLFVTLLLTISLFLRRGIRKC
jgi:hypothetical protein